MEPPLQPRFLPTHPPCVFQRGEEYLKEYRSEKGARAFCQDCGSRLMNYDTNRTSYLSIALSALQSPGGLRPQRRMLYYHETRLCSPGSGDSSLRGPSTDSTLKPMGSSAETQNSAPSTKPYRWAVRTDWRARGERKCGVQRAALPELLPAPAKSPAGKEPDSYSGCLPVRRASPGSSRALSKVARGAVLGASSVRARTKAELLL